MSAPPSPAALARANDLLFAASAYGNAADVAAALAAGADSNQPEQESKATPLSLAAQFGHLDCVGALLAAGADPWAPSGNSGGTPVGRAMARKHWEILQTLLRAPGHEASKALRFGDEWARALSTGEPALIETFLGAGASLDAPIHVDERNSRETPLGLALRQRCEGSVAELLRLGADPEAPTQSLTQESACRPIAIAVFMRWIPGIEAILGAGADPGEDRDYGVLAARAIDNYWRDGEVGAVFSALASAGAPLASPAQGGELLAFAVQENCWEAVQWLCDQGVDPTAALDTADAQAGALRRAWRRSQPRDLSEIPQGQWMKATASQIAAWTPEQEGSAIVLAASARIQEAKEIGEAAAPGSQRPGGARI